MPDYRESTISGTSWWRARRVIIENPLDAVPSLLICEEQALSLGGTVITQPIANLTAQMDPADPLHQEIYKKLNELYVLLREVRDAAGTS
jgi:hypothetical protein